ncbi:DUF3443 family protein [Streptoverticillium reticulum]|uniref:DUF3443 family protein n=1 Tax=Streptoverticillium reticulum TaxID=1433415 RepID=UPI0039BFCFB6
MPGTRTVLFTEPRAGAARMLVQETFPPQLEPIVHPTPYPSSSSSLRPRRGRRWRTAAAVCAALLAAALPGGCAGSGPDRSAVPGGVTVPLRYMPAGSAGGKLSEPRLQATATIGRKQVSLLVDTGSTGLKVLTSAVGDGNATPTGVTGSSSYLSGLQISGREAQADLRLGDVTARNQTVLLVDSLGCIDQVPDCEAAHGTPEEFGGVFDGILGIGLAERDQGVRGCCANPMAGLTNNGAFTVHFDEQHPELVLNPDRKTLERFTTVSLKRSATLAPSPGGSPTTVTAWDPAPLQGCLTVTGVLNTRCAPVLFDTGTPTLALEAPRFQGPVAGAVLKGGMIDTFGRQVTLAVTTADWKWTYRMPARKTAGKQPMNALSTPLVSYGLQARPLILAGLPAFTKTDVLYDLKNGRTGLSPR